MLRPALSCLALAVAAAPCLAMSRGLLTDFESLAPIYDWDQGAEPGCTVELSAEQAHSGTHSAKITYDYVERPGIQYQSLGTSLLMVGHPTAVSAWFLGDGSGLPVVLRVTDAGGEVHQFRWGQLDFTGWRELRAELKNPLVIYQGDGNERMDWPIRLSQVIIDHGPRPAKGVVYVDDLSYETDAPPSDFLTATVIGTEPGNVYVLGKRPPRFVVEARNGSADTRLQATINVKLIGPDGTALERQALACDLAPGGCARSDEVTVKPRRAGLYRLAVTLAGKPERTPASAPACVLPDEGDGRLDPASPFAVCAHFGQGKGRHPDSFQLMARAGVKWLRDECPWAAVEQRKGVYTFPESAEAFLRAAQAHGITPLIILDYGNSLYDGGQGPTSDEAQAAFGEYCFRMVSRFQGLCRHWEVYNEPNIGFWQPKPDPAAYARLLKIAYAACKRADPGCTVVGICTAGTDLAFIRTVLQQSGPQFMDALSIHPYRYPASPEASRFVDEVTGAHQLLSELGGGKQRVWLTEIGWPTHTGPGGVTEEVSARMLVRMYVQAMSLPFTGPIVWYDFQNDGLNAKYNEDNFGLIRWDDFSAKAGYLAYRMMTRALAGKTFRSQLKLGEGAHAYVFGGGRQTTVVAWLASPEEGKQALQQSVALRLDAKRVEVSRITGEVGKASVDRGTLRLTLTPSPVFIRGRFREAQAAAPPLRLQLERTEDVAPGTALRGTLEANGLSGCEARFELPEGWKAEPSAWRPRGDDDRTPFRLLVPVTAAAGSHTARVEASGGPVSASASLSVAPPLQRTVRFSSVGEGLQVAWSACNRTATDLHAVSTSLGETAPAGREALAPGQCVEATATVAPVPGQAAALQTLVARFGSREGVAVETRLQANVWPVPRATRTIEVDGSLGEWPELPVSLPLTPEAVPLDSGSAHGRFALMAGQSWLGPRDTSAKVGLLQDERSLYLAADVTDDRHFQPETGAEVWQGDNIQLAVDFDPTQHLPPAREAGGPCEIGLTLGGRGAEVFRWLPFGGPAEGQGPLTARVPCAVVREGDRTRYEAAIPWQALLAPPGWRPTPGAVLGFALLINDNDSAGRKGWLQLFDGIGYGKSRDKYGLVILAA